MEIGFTHREETPLQHATGVPVANVKISLFMISTSLACLLGILTVMTSGASDPKSW